MEKTFSAAHAILIAEKREAVHGHDWRLTVTLEGPELDADGLLVDFHALERLIDEIIGPFRNNDLNRVPPFDRVNPSAEHVARHIGEAVSAGLARMRWGPAAGGAERSVRVESVWITEAPGCRACFIPPNAARPTDPLREGGR